MVIVVKEARMHLQAPDTWEGMAFVIIPHEAGTPSGARGLIAGCVAGVGVQVA